MRCSPQSKKEAENHFLPISENKTGAWHKEVSNDQPGSFYLPQEKIGETEKNGLDFVGDLLCLRCQLRLF